jgi:3',5'-cyclic AMP phosphodiesterase CpdA
MSLRIAITADLHWGHRTGADAVRLLASYLHAEPPDVLVLAGDLGVGLMFGDCLRLFADLPCRKALVPGNHDVWVQADGADYDSLTLYDKQLPHCAERFGFHHLDQGPLLLPDAGLALVGSMNWYDYSWALDELRRRFPTEEHRLHSKRFTRGRHNDANFVRWPLDDVQFTARVVATFARQLQSALATTDKAIVIVHHPPFHGLSFPQQESPLPLDALLWEAFSGNRAMEEVLARHAERIPFAFCGHTHRAREAMLGPIRGYNIGGDYAFKRLLVLNWPEGTVTTHEFGDEASGVA